MLRGLLQTRFADLFSYSSFCSAPWSFPPSAAPMHGYSARPIFKPKPFFSGGSTSMERRSRRFHRRTCTPLVSIGSWNSREPFPSGRIHQRLFFDCAMAIFWRASRFPWRENRSSGGRTLPAKQKCRCAMRFPFVEPEQPTRARPLHRRMMP